jgi:toxin ParE1/3/4
MRVRWTAPAAIDLENIHHYLQEHYPEHRNKTILTLYRAAKSLRWAALRGRHGRVEGTRELILPSLPYIIVYRIKNEIVEVLRVYHASQQRE